MVHKVQDKVPQPLSGVVSMTCSIRVASQATGQSKVLKSVVRPEGWDDERLKLEALQRTKCRMNHSRSIKKVFDIPASSQFAGPDFAKLGPSAHPSHLFLVRRGGLHQHRLCLTSFSESVWDGVG